nr:MAG TPA: Learning-associated protein [Bacteriophage sp.]
MNNVVEKAYKINEHEKDFNIDIPDVKIGDVVKLDDIWDGEGETPVKQYSYLVSNCGEDGDGNYPVWINYVWETVDKDRIKIIDIQLI